jgi:hypothetical protein
MLRQATSMVPFLLHVKMPPLLLPSLATIVQQIHVVPLGPLGPPPIHFPASPIVLTIFLVVDHMLTNPIMQCLKWCVELI